MLDEQGERARQDQKWKWGVIVAGVLLFLATLAAPTLAVWVENR